MAGIDERVKGFLESWKTIQKNIPLNVDVLRCVICDRELEDGRFALVDGDLICLNCMKGLQEK